MSCTTTEISYILHT